MDVSIMEEQQDLTRKGWREWFECMQGCVCCLPWCLGLPFAYAKYKAGYDVNWNCGCLKCYAKRTVGRLSISEN